MNNLCIGVPQHAPASIFDHVNWSQADTCLSQCKQLFQAQVLVNCGSAYSDIDTAEDLLQLHQRVIQNNSSNDVEMPRVRKFLQELSISSLQP